MYPVYWAFKNKYERVEIKWVSTNQHKDLTSDLEDFFELKPDFEFKIKDSYKQESRLGELGADILSQATKLFVKEKPDLVFVQGDTISTQNVALAAFYQRIKIAHIEAGLRTNDIANPFPEELSRRIVSQIADLNFAPELKALENLEIEKNLFKKQSYNFYTGNTVIDALSLGLQKSAQDDFKFPKVKNSFENKKESISELTREKYILVTAHRRENFLYKENKAPIENLINSIKRLLEDNYAKDFNVVIVVHKNPLVRTAFENFYYYCKDQKISRIKFIEAVNYPSFLKLMSESYFIVTDSGGVQEEAPYLKKPVLVFRELTERIAGLDLGLTKLVGTQENKIHGAILDLIHNKKSYQDMIETGLQPYGDGLAASRIVDASHLYLNKKE